MKLILCSNLNKTTKDIYKHPLLFHFEDLDYLPAKEEDISLRS